MPLYEYKCENCAWNLEVLRPLGDHVQTCPVCGGGVSRVYGQFTFRFRRRGWKPYSVDDSGPETMREETCVG